MNGDIRNEGPQRDIHPSPLPTACKSEIDQRVSSVAESLEKPTPEPQKKYSISIWTRFSDLIFSVWNRFFGKVEAKPALVPSINPALFHKYDSSPEALQFYQATKRIPSAEMALIKKELENLEGHEEEIKAEFKAFESGNFNIADWDKASYRALFALKKGYISLEAFSTFLNFRIAHQKYIDLEIVPLFLKDGSPNPRVVEHLKKTGEYFQGNDFILKKKRFLKDESIDAYFEAMKNKSLAAQTLILGKPKQEPNLASMGYIVKRMAGIELYNFMEGRKVIPSFEMMQTVLDVAYGREATKINPVIGLSAWGDIKTNNISKSRDMALQFPGVSLPEEADDLETYGIEFTYHDFYHALITSNIPQSMQQLMNMLGEILNYYKTDDPEKRKVLEKFRDKLVDMELTEFRQDELKDGNLSEAFWESLLGKWHKASPNNEHIEILQYLFVELKKLSREIDWEKESGVSSNIDNDLTYVQFWANLEEKFQHYLGFIFPKG